MSKTIYMIRHGQTDWNASRRLQGQLDVAMNDHGRGQVLGNARKLAAHLPHPERYNYVTSPISRAVETMTIIQRELNHPATEIKKDPRLAELNYGIFASKSWDELRQICPELVARRFKDSWSYTIPEGECYAILAKRVFEWFDEVEEDTVVTAHAGISRVLQSRFTQVAKEKIAFLDAPQDRVLVINEEGMNWL